MKKDERFEIAKDKNEISSLSLKIKKLQENLDNLKREKQNIELLLKGKNSELIIIKESIEDSISL